MSRESDSHMLIVRWHRLRDIGLRIRARQTDFSGVSALLTMALALTLLTELVVGHAHVYRAVAFACLIGFGALTIIPLWAGKRYPRWAGLAVIGALTLWSAGQVFQATHAHTELGALLQSPMVALYLGWFYRPALARFALLFSLMVILMAILWRVEPASNGYSSAIAFGYAVLISALGLEAGSFLRRRALARADFDPLTGVLNRRGLVARAPRMIAEAQRTGTPLSVALVDFDDFKAVNDQGGHAAGDEALRATARAWAEGLGARDLIARVGGDEFLLLLHSDGDTANARLCDIARGAPYAWTWGLTQVRPGDSLDDLMSRADGRMYGAKGQHGPDSTGEAAMRDSGKH